MGLLTRIFTKSGADAPKASTQPAGDGWDLGSVSEILRHFPIGSRVLYCPEFKKELRLESIILGCSINQHLVYSQSDLSLPEVGSAEDLVVRGEVEDHHVREVKTFYLVVPHQSRSEIDYRPEAANGSGVQMVQNAVNDFGRGNYITLISFSPYGRVPHLETRVKSTTVLSKGYYAGHKVSLLDPYANTLSYFDKRRHQRVSTRIPASLQLSAEGAEHPCLLEDFSERFARVRLRDKDALFEGLESGRRLLLHLDLPPSDSGTTLQAAVYRKVRGSVVLELRALLKDGRFSTLQLVDQLDLKARLLHHPETQSLLQKQRQRDRKPPGELP